MIIQGDCLVKLKELEDNSVDSIVTDPPYELGFMGKSWDNTGIANNKDMWAECLRVLKPGGHLLAFSGTRTYHRMASAIEDAGFEVRDMIEWVYGSGFPKSLNIGKILDKNAGNIKETTETLFNNPNKKTDLSKRSDYGYKFEPKSENAKQWEGWGTALKPSHETIAVAQKPFDNRSDIDYTKSICQTLLVEIALKSSELNLNEKTRLAIVRWTAEKNINTLEDLSEVMDMLQSELETNLNLNIVSSWLNILGEIWGAMSMFTTETKGSLTTELKILQSLEWENIFQNITQVKSNQISGYSANVLNVENLLNAVKLKLKYILTHSAQENAISQGNKLNFAPNHEPICMARKPLSEKTVAENCLKYGTGGINIDESRVGVEKIEINGGGKKWRNNGKEIEYVEPINEERIGRFPANLILESCEEVRECFPESNNKGHFPKNVDKSNPDLKYGKYNSYEQEEQWLNDSGNASRFFKSIIYQSKASKSERNKGCEELEEKESVYPGINTFDENGNRLRDDGSVIPPLKSKNNHPTVKPIALMEYLIKMITPKGGTVLDPFAGSGSTLVAAKQIGFQFIGIEMTPEYIPIIEARLKGIIKENTLF